MWEEVYVLFLKGAMLRIQHDQQFLGKRCCIEKNCWLDGDGI